MNLGNIEGRAALVAGTVVLLGIGTLAGFVLGRSTSGGIALARPVRGAIAQVLSTAASGEERQVGAVKVRLLSMFANNRAQHCRSFSLAGAESAMVVACRYGDAWRPTIAIDSASGSNGEAELTAHLRSIGATVPFTREGEATILDSYYR